MSIHDALDFDREKVSIITPCFNAENFLKKTYHSLQTQTFSNWEWVVCDDLSTDNSYQILLEIQQVDPRLKIIKNKKNAGAAQSRNNCIDSSTGEYLAFLDVDDLWVQEKLTKQINFMKDNNCDFSYHPYSLIDSNDKFIKDIAVPNQVSANDLLKFNPFATSSVIIRKSIINTHIIRFKVHLRRRQDYLFWFETIKHCGKAIAIQEKLSKYRVFGNDSLSGNKKKMALIQWKLYREEFNLGFMKSCYYFLCYATHGIKKYFL